MPRKKPGQEAEGVRKHDGRTQIVKAIKKMTPTRLSKAKKERVRIHAINGITEEYGSEEEFWAEVAKQSRKSFRHLDLLVKYAFPDPKDIKPAPPQKQTNIIQFVNPDDKPKKTEEKTIGISHLDEN